MMKNINERFKDAAPEETINKIQNILKSLGIEIEEKVQNAGSDYLWSAHLSAQNAYPLRSNGKGTTKNLALASAYGEFIERIQCGLMFYKFQSMERDPVLDLQRYAPDGKYMTEEELVENGSWMDPLIKRYGHGLTREKVARLCKIYSDADDGRILTVPYYNLFENKSVYLPTGFVEHIYSANGCCAGNSKEEAWIHALSEVMERHCTIRMLTERKTAPVVPKEVLSRYPRVMNVLDKITSTGEMDVQILDFSICEGLPVVATRLIDKRTQNYLVNVAADPVLEIAFDRTLTECFQGRSFNKLGIWHKSKTMEEAPNIPTAHNVLNQMETGNGVFSLDFFLEDQLCEKSCTQFVDNSKKNNKELLEYVLNLYRGLGYPVYVRNNSFLGFHTYHFIIPGFSETRGFRLIDPLSEYAIGSSVQKAFRDVNNASHEDLVTMLSFHKMIGTAFSRWGNYAKLAGLPIFEDNKKLFQPTMFTAAYRLGRIDSAREFLKPLINREDSNSLLSAYASCVDRYLCLKLAKVPEEKILPTLRKFFKAELVEKLEATLLAGKTPLEDFLVSCDTVHCEDCRYNKSCSYVRCSSIMKQVGERYHQFTDGQKEEVFCY